MERRVKAYKDYFLKFINSLNDSQARKVFYELRAEYAGDIFRVLFIFDEGQIILLFNGFHKKTQKTPRKEIELAKKLRREYYDDKSK